MTINVSEFYAIEKAVVHEDLDAAIKLEFAHDPDFGWYLVYPNSVEIPMNGAEAVPLAFEATLFREKGEDRWRTDMKLILREVKMCAAWPYPARPHAVYVIKVKEEPYKVAPVVADKGVCREG